MNKKELDKVLKLHKKWLLSDGGERACLRGADLSGADLRGAYLRGAYLRGAYLSGAYLSGADLTRADLTRADLSGADLTRADLTRVYLTGAYLSGADLRGADLSGADLRGADLEEIAVSWMSHDLIAEILKRASGENISKRQLAGLILVSREMCWDDFVELKIKHKTWAIRELKKWVKDGDGAPEWLK